MSQFIDLEDYDASIHREILDALIRDDDSLIEICEDRAIAQMRSYLAKRYDCDKIFSLRSPERNQLILMMAIDIAVYHIFCIHNPMKLSQIRKDRYERAVEWLKSAGRGDISIDGAPLLPAQQQAAHDGFIIRSNPKRVNHF